MGPKKNTHQKAFLVPKGLLIQLATIAQSPTTIARTKTIRKTTAKSSITLFIYLILYNSTNSKFIPKNVK